MFELPFECFIFHFLYKLFGQAQAVFTKKAPYSYKTSKIACFSMVSLVRTSVVLATLFASVSFSLIFLLSTLLRYAVDFITLSQDSHLLRYAVVLSHGARQRVLLSN